MQTFISKTTDELNCIPMDFEAAFSSKTKSLIVEKTCINMQLDTFTNLGTLCAKATDTSYISTPPSIKNISLFCGSLFLSLHPNTAIIDQLWIVTKTYEISNVHIYHASKMPICIKHLCITNNTILHVQRPITILQLTIGPRANYPANIVYPAFVNILSRREYSNTFHPQGVRAVLVCIDDTSNKYICRSWLSTPTPTTHDIETLECIAFYNKTSNMSHEQLSHMYSKFIGFIPVPFHKLDAAIPELPHVQLYAQRATMLSTETRSFLFQSALE